MGARLRPAQRDPAGGEYRGTLVTALPAVGRNVVLFTTGCQVRSPQRKALTRYRRLRFGKLVRKNLPSPQSSLAESDMLEARFLVRIAIDFLASYQSRFDVRRIDESDHAQVRNGAIAIVITRGGKCVANQRRSPITAL